MKKSFSFPNNTRFSYDTETAALTLTDLCGMTCGHNMQEDDYSCSGLAVVCVDEKRLEPHPMPEKQSLLKPFGSLNRNMILSTVISV